jgi:hypothetical protein
MLTLIETYVWNVSLSLHRRSNDLNKRFLVG